MAIRWTNPLHPRDSNQATEEHCQAPALQLDESAFAEQLAQFEQCARRQAARGLRPCARPQFPRDESDQVAEALRLELDEFARCVHEQAQNEAAKIEQTRRNRELLGISGTITLVAVVLFGARMLWTGMPMDTAVLALIVIALVPWLGRIVKNLEVAGTKIEFRDIEQKLAQTQEEMHITFAATKDAVDTIRGAGQSSNMQLKAAIAEVARVARPEASPQASGMSAREAMDSLANQYNSIRELQKPGDTRTEAMTKIWVQMRDLVPSLQDFDIRRALLQEKGGKRLEGYAYLYERPDPNMLHDLIASVGKTGADGRFDAKPFEQYWGLLTIRQLQESPEFSATVAGARDQLAALLGKLKPGTDRHFVLSRILAVMDRPTPAPTA